MPRVTDRSSNYSMAPGARSLAGRLNYGDRLVALATRDWRADQRHSATRGAATDRYRQRPRRRRLRKPSARSIQFWRRGNEWRVSGGGFPANGR